MASCEPKIWKAEELTTALQGTDKDNQRIVVPMFQRGRCWKLKQEKIFIDSIIKGYPIGSMLFHERKDGNETIYVLVDGLQRSNTLKKYISDPLSFIENKDFTDDECSQVLQKINIEKNKENIVLIRQLLITFIKQHKKYDELQYTDLQTEIIEKFNLSYTGQLLKDIAAALDIVFQEKKDLYNTVKNTQIPIVVYHGDDTTLPEIFGRINSKGTPLSQYEIYAATWDIDSKFPVDNNEIININVQKYKNFEKDNYFVDKFDINEILNKQQLNCFDYLYGLSRYLVSRFQNLRFNEKWELNPLGFELVNACLNNCDMIDKLDTKILKMDVNNFEKALINAINFVDNAIKPITQFKGNKRQSNKIFHSKFQIMSMIAAVFKAMYEGTDYQQENSNWKKTKDTWAQKLLRWYINDIITNYWSDGGTKKIYQVANSPRYLQDISKATWNSDLDSFFNKSLQRAETLSKKVAPAKAEEYVILNTIYQNKFTAMDNLGLDKFDIEHIAPKEQMASLIKATNGSGLAISNIANLCYLPEFANRTKHDKNFYQDENYGKKVDIKEVEDKYSFTNEEDLTWMNNEYKTSEDYTKLKNNYEIFCRNRFQRIKNEFFEALNIK